ncbi:MAG TPA: peptidoglycan DD-metalloendopeptidase family protein [Firmicutes bacterium]|nr:peptidoglycan DD-metalloendopeptidase family protein [Bacillota bacterium]
MPVYLLHLAGALVLGAAVALAWFGYDYQRLRSAAAEVHTLRSVNREQSRQLENLAARAADVEQRLGEINDLEAQVRQMLNLPQTSTGAKAAPTSSAAPSRGGPGRPARYADIDAALTEAAQALQPTQARLADLKTRVAQYQHRLEHQPDSWPARGSITSRFGLRRSPFGRSVEFHEGVDISAPYGAPVRAAAAGRVVFAGWKNGYGRFVIIDHGYGFQTAYGHNSKLNVRVGQIVKKGDVIANVGSTGRSTGPHVHYEVIYQGQKRNPLQYLP